MKKFVKSCIVFVLLIVLIIISYNYIFLKAVSKFNLEKSSSEIINNELPFAINKITLYSSINGLNKEGNSDQSNWILNLYQYTDISISIVKNNENLSANNTIKELYIENINFYNEPKIGTPSLYYLNPQNFGTEKYAETDKIDNKLEFTVLNDKNEDNSVSTTTPVMFSDLSNPITLKYVNQNIYKNFVFPTSEFINFDGSLLNRVDISTASLEASLSFYIVTVNNNDETFKHLVNVNIPVNNIQSGHILEIIDNLDYRFIKDEV